MNGSKEKAKEVLEFLGIDPTPESLILAEKLYKKISEEALKNQWISVSEALPGEYTRVLCMMKDSGEVVSGYIIKNLKGYPEVATDPYFHFEDDGGYECTHWMPEPPDTPDLDGPPADLVTLEQAEELMKLGFKEPCTYHYYSPISQEPRRGFLRSHNSISQMFSVDAPSQAQAGWWLEEKIECGELKDIPDCLEPLIE